MTEPVDKKDENLENLTEDQKRLLSETLSQMETKLFLGTLRKLKIYIALTLGVLLGVLTLNGAFTFTGIRSAIVEKATVAIAHDPEFRKQVKEDIAKDIEWASDLIQKSQELSTILEKENARIAATLPKTLMEIHGMVAQIKEDLKKMEAKSDET
jgi:hypothetical protein